MSYFMPNPESSAVRGRRRHRGRHRKHKVHRDFESFTDKLRDWAVMLARTGSSISRLSDKISFKVDLPWLQGTGQQGWHTPTENSFQNPTVQVILSLSIHFILVLL